jgi:hypothetical protein
MRMQPSPRPLSRYRGTYAAEHSVSGLASGKTEICLMSAASHAGKLSVGAFARVQIPIVSGAKCV